MSLYVTDLSGREYPLQATLTHDLELNGNQSVSASILPSKINAAFIDNIAEMWHLTDFEGVTHKVIYAKKRGEGKSLTVEVKAIPLFFDTFDTLRIYEEYNEHMTAQLAFTRIFADTPFTFVLVDQFDAVSWEGFGGGESRLETFKRAIERYKCEFRIVGNTVYLEKQIGRDTQFQYRYRLNASNITQENDASAMWTYAKGYGDYDDSGEDGEGGGWEEAKLIREYTSPLAEIIGIRHAPPIKDGRIKVASTMDASLKELVDESLKISVSADIHDLRRQGYPLAQPELGDRVFLIDERIGLDEEVRVVDIKIMRNWKGEVLDLQLTFGSEGLTKRHQSNMQTAIKDITDVMAGRKKIPFSAYDAAVINATNALKRITSELVVPENGGLMAVDKNNPNNVVLFNAAGIGVSDDGGTTFKNSITGEGVVAETIIGQSIIGVNLSSIDESGYFHVNGSNAEFVNTSNNRRVTISPDGLYGYNANNDVRFRADSLLVTSAALGTSNSNVYLAAGAVNEARVVDVNQIPSDGAPESYTYLPMRALGYRFGPGANGYIGTDGEVRITSMGFTQADGSVIYRDLRAATIYGYGFSTNSTNAYIGSDDEVRLVNKGYIDSSTGNPIYRNVRGYRGFFDGIGNNAGNNLYLGANNEVYVTSIGMADNNPIVWRPLRAAGIHANYIDTNGATNATHIYVRPSATGEAQITARGTTNTYRPIRARDFITDTSIRENKRDIEVYDEDVLDYFRAANAYLYNRENEPTYTKKQLGLMLDEMPYETYSERGDGFGIYGLVAFLFRGLKQAVEEIDRLKGAS